MTNQSNDFPSALKKFIFGLLITFIGLVFSAFSFMYAIMNPVSYNGTSNLFTHLLCNDLLLPFILSTTVMLFGVYICWSEAYQRHFFKR